MVVVINKPAENITEEELEKIFRLANECYEFNLDDRSLRRATDYLKTQGMDLLRRHWPIDYRPWMGAKFFIQPVGKLETWVWGYTGEDDVDKDLRFEKRVKELFTMSP